MQRVVGIRLNKQELWNWKLFTAFLSPSTVLGNSVSFRCFSRNCSGLLLIFFQLNLLLQVNQLPWVRITCFLVTRTNFNLSVIFCIWWGLGMSNVWSQFRAFKFNYNGLPVPKWLWTLRSTVASNIFGL